MIGRNRKGASGAVALASIGHWWQQRADLGCRAATQLHEGAVGPMAGRCGVSPQSREERDNGLSLARRGERLLPALVICSYF
jgi:hypothetical protein